MATALLVVTAIAAVGSVVQQRKISKAQRRQNRLTNKVSAITRQRDVKRSIAARRIQVAQQQAAGFQLGVSGGTAVQGAVAGVTGDVATAIGQSNLRFSEQQFLSAEQNRISVAQQAQAGFGALASLTGAFIGSGLGTGAQTTTAADTSTLGIT